MAKLARHLVQRDRRTLFELQLDFADRNHRAPIGERADFSAVERKLDVFARMRLQRARRAPDLGLDDRLDRTTIGDGLQLQPRFGVGNELQVGLWPSSILHSYSSRSEASAPALSSFTVCTYCRPVLRTRSERPALANSKSGVS